MNGEQALLKKIKQLIGAQRYRVRSHAVRHMVEEGFSEADMIKAVAVRSRILENYPEEHRCLILGYFMLTANTRSPLHLVCDYSVDEVVDVVTAYIPQKPWWLTPVLRGKRK